LGEIPREVDAERFSGDHKREEEMLTFTIRLVRLNWILLAEFSGSVEKFLCIRSSSHSPSTMWFCLMVSDVCLASLLNGKFSFLSSEFKGFVARALFFPKLQQ